MLRNWTFTYVSPQNESYRRHFDEAKYISFLIKDDELSKKYNEIWEEVKNNL